MAAVRACRGGQSPPPIGTDDCHHGLVAAVLISNRSPMRWPKLVGRFHLPSAVCPPSVFGETPSDGVWQEPRALDGPGAQSFMTHNPHRGGRNWSVPSAFRPTFVRLPSAFSTFGAPSGAFSRELGRKFTTFSAFRTPSASLPLARLRAASSLEQRRSHLNAANEGLPRVVLGAHEPVPI
jgi:hypothetical protein